ncbi:MAG: MarR family transcriptional regulator [Tissierellia bacterium]|nr:MarR family transcriptional regulator [Tissierellia bacterium]
MMDQFNNARHLGKELRQVLNLFARLAEARAVKMGITFSQGRLLHYISLKKDGSIRQKDIEYEFNIRGSSATEMLQKLEKNGYIERSEDEEDKRSKLIHITQKGRDTEKTIYQNIRSFEKQIRDGLSQEEVDLFFDVVEKIKTNLENILEEDI